MATYSIVGTLEDVVEVVKWPPECGVVVDELS
jgi:hypothetical protein